MLTSETQPLMQALNEYIWPKSIEKLAAGLSYDVKGRMVCVSGLQGVGKSLACTMIYQRLKMSQPLYPVLTFQFPRDGDWIEAVWRATPNASDLFNNKADQYELKTNRKFRRYHIARPLRAVQTVLIDLGDYARRDARLMNRDIDLIQDLWKVLLEQGVPATNLLVFMQKELYKGHFFLGKFEHVELKPFSAAELVEAYKKRFEDIAPFEEAALLELARMSRGIFRRFKRYIHKCVEAYQPDTSTLITVDFVRKTISFDEIAADLELQLSGIFSKPEHRTIAIRVLEHARLNPELNQTELAQRLEIDDMTLSRILRRLELNNYIQRKQGEHGEKKLNLMLMASGRDLERMFKDAKKRRR